MIKHNNYSGNGGYISEKDLAIRFMSCRIGDECGASRIFDLKGLELCRFEAVLFRLVGVKFSCQFPNWLSLVSARRLQWDGSELARFASCFVLGQFEGLK